MKIKSMICLILIAASLFSLVGCIGERDYVYCEIGFSLPRAYREINAEDDFDMAFEHWNTVIGIRRYSFEAVVNEGILATHSPLKFAEIYRDRLTGIATSAIREHGYIPYFIYTLDTPSGRYAYMPTFYRTPYAYFVIILVTKNELNDGGRVEFLEICDSVYILPEYV